MDFQRVLRGPTVIKTTSVLMPLSQLTRVSNFCSNSVLPFLSIIRILSSQDIVPNPSLWNLPMTSLVNPSSFPQLFQRSYLPVFLQTDVSTHSMTIPSQENLTYHIPNLHNNTHLIMKNKSWHPINQSHRTHHPDHTMLIRKSKFPRLKTLQQN